MLLDWCSRAFHRMDTLLSSLPEPPSEPTWFRRSARTCFSGDLCAGATPCQQDRSTCSYRRFPRYRTLQNKCPGWWCHASDGELARRDDVGQGRDAGSEGIVVENLREALRVDNWPQNLWWTRGTSSFFVTSPHQNTSFRLQREMFDCASPAVGTGCPTF